jgi:hypothetical protein
MRLRSIDINRILVGKKLKEREVINKDRENKIPKGEWEILKKIMYKEGGEKVRKEIRNIIEERKKTSQFKKDKEKAEWIHDENFMRQTRETIYTDGLSKKDKAGFGVWDEKTKKEVAYSVIGSQTSYNGELQEMIYRVSSTCPNTERSIKIDNSAVLRIAKKIERGEAIP